MTTALLVDGNSVLMRAVHTPNTMSVGGVPTGALQIFAQTLAKHVRVEQPARLVVCWDGGRDPGRTALFPGYKAHRGEAPDPEFEERKDGAFALAQQFCTLAGIPQARVGQVEADDLIAGAWSAIGDVYPEVDRIVVLSQDADFAQLVGPNPHGVSTEWVQLSSFATGTDRWTEERLLAEHEIPGTHVLGMIKALAGDKSDNLPGIRGIGPVKAKMHLAGHGWDLDALARAKPEWSETIHIMYRLVNLRNIQKAVIVPHWNPVLPGHPAYEDLLVFFRRYELARLQDRLVDGSLWEPDRPTTSSGDLPVRNLFHRLNPDLRS